jgi:polysaccharide export outer membrane protein
MTHKRSPFKAIGLFCAGIVSASGCAASTPFVWVDELPPAALVPEAYRIEPGDTLTVSVWNQQKMSGDVKVRSDGQVTLPLLGDVAVLNLTPSGAAQQIEHRLDGLVVDPKVTVAIKESQPATFSMVGQIKNSGSYPLRPGVGLLQAIAAAGGLTEFANPSKIFVIRKDNSNKRIRFTYDKLSHAEGRGVTFQLRDGDIVVVE